MTQTQEGLPGWVMGTQASRIASMRQVPTISRTATSRSQCDFGPTRRATNATVPATTMPVMVKYRPGSGQMAEMLGRVALNHRPASSIIPRMISQMTATDIAATLLDLFGQPPPPENLGHSLLHTVAGTAPPRDAVLYGVFGSAGGTFDLNGSIVIGGNTYAMSTPTLFSNAPGALPNVGALVLRDATGDQVILRARSATTFDLEFQAAGAATPTVVSPGLLWNSYKL